MQQREAKQPVMMASILRILATILIFVFHYRGLEGLPKYPIDKIGIFIFVLISGYFSFQPHIAPARWFLRRVLQIMTPYWSVIFVVLVVNAVYGYKDVNFITNIIIFFGGSLFVENPVYVISWFITYILLLYLCLAVFLSIKYTWTKIFFLFLCGAFFVDNGIGNVYYFIGFFLGFFINKFFKNKLHSKHNNNIFRIINVYLYKIQNHSYSFFLIHGGVLKLVFNIFLFNGMLALILSFLITSIISVYHKKFSDLCISSINQYFGKYVILR